MILRAQDLKGKIVYFGVQDAPVCINNKQTILCNVPNSPILLSSTIARGLEDKSIFEFDFVTRKEDHKFLGFIVYVDGFYIWDSKKNTLTEFRNPEQYSILQNTRSYRMDDIHNVRSSIRFSNGSRLFRLNRIMYSDKEYIYIELKGHVGPVSINSIKMCTGVGSGRNEFAFGDFVSDGEIVLHDYHPMVKLANGEFRELESEDYVK